MYAFFIPPTLPKSEREKLAAAIAQVAQGFRLEAQVFHHEPLIDAVQKAYSLRSSVFIPFGDSLWFDTVVTHSIQYVPDGFKLPTYSPFAPPPPPPILRDQFLQYYLRKKMSILAARRLSRRHLYQAGDHYFLESLTLQATDQAPVAFSLNIHMVHESHLACDLQASEITLQAYQHAEYEQEGLLYVTAWQPPLRGSEKLQSGRPLAKLSSQLTISQLEPILRVPLKRIVLRTTRSVSSPAASFQFPLEISTLPDQITVIEAKNSKR